MQVVLRLWRSLACYEIEVSNSWACTTSSAVSLGLDLGSHLWINGNIYFEYTFWIEFSGKLNVWKRGELVDFGWIVVCFRKH